MKESNIFYYTYIIFYIYYMSSILEWQEGVVKDETINDIRHFLNDWHTKFE